MERCEGEAGSVAVPRANTILPRWGLWLAIHIVPIPAANLIERLCIDPVIRDAWDASSVFFPAMEKLLSRIGLLSPRSDLTAILWNQCCAVAQTLPYVLLVVGARLVSLHFRGGFELRPLTARRTLGVLGLAAATWLPPLVTGWGIMVVLNALLQSDAALAATFVAAFNELLPWFGYALNKGPAALMALAALHMAVQPAP